MNKNQRAFVSELRHVALFMSDMLDRESREDDGGSVGRAVWRAMNVIGPRSSLELEGLLRGAAADDSPEVSGWFCYISRTYGKYSEVLTFSQILCCVFRTGCFRDAAEVLRVLSKVLTLSSVSGNRPDLTAVWLEMINRKEIMFSGLDVRSQLAAQLCLCVGDSKYYRSLMSVLLVCIFSGSEETAIEDRILKEIGKRKTTIGETRLYMSLEESILHGRVKNDSEKAENG